MTVKEKAEELVARFKAKIDHQDHYWGVDDEAKECALIAVEEIIKTNPQDGDEFPLIDYWQEVKKEIEKL